MAPHATNPRIVQFGLFELDLDAGELRKSGIRIKLQEQPFQILSMLLERPGAVVTREELQKKLWPGDTFVDFDLSLNSAVKKLRQALNDDSENPRYVETLYRRGYRFIGSVNGSPSSNGGASELAPSAEEAAVEAVLVHAASAPAAPGRRSLLYGAVTLFLILAAVVVAGFIPSQPPRVLGFTQITHDGRQKFAMVSDGERLYFWGVQGTQMGVSQVSVAGGDTSTLPTPFTNVIMGGISPDGSAMLVRSFVGTGGTAETWSLPLPAGPPRRMGDTPINHIAWFPHGNEVVFSRGPEIYVAKSDLSEPRKLATARDPVFGLRFSPDGLILRFDVGNLDNGPRAIWEMASNGGGMRPLFPGWTKIPHECCGNWTPDGKYFLFQSFRDGRNSLWALKENSSWLRRTPKPIQLTNGPLDFASPLVSKDGKRIFAVGSQPRCEVVSYDGKFGFAPYLDGRSARDLAFSADGKWVAYVTVPEGQLWRSRIDGSERLQLTSEGIYAGLPRWSRDGRQIVFIGSSLNTDWLPYLISSDATGMRELIPGAETGDDP